MATFKSFEEIEVWKKARLLTKEVYLVTNKDLFKTDFRLKDQIRSASSSIMANISEGYERDGNKEFIQFLYIAKASSGEVRSHLYVAFDQNYVTESEFNSIKAKAEEISKMLRGLIEYLRNSELKGMKYKKDEVDKNQ